MNDFTPAEHSATGDLEVMIALGADFPAPAGSHVFAVRMPANADTGYGDTGELLGIVTSTAAGIRLLAAAARSAWDWDTNLHHRRTAPWMTRELYENATGWRTPDLDATEQSAALARTVATAAMAAIRLAQSAWLDGRTDEQIAATFIEITTGAAGDSYWPAWMDHGTHPGTFLSDWHPWITEWTVGSTARPSTLITT